MRIDHMKKAIQTSGHYFKIVQMTSLSYVPSSSLCFSSCCAVGVTLSSDFIAGFCGETEEEHRDTVSLMDTVKFDMAYMFAYSMRKVSGGSHTHPS